MLLSVILITWNGRKLLSNCLKSMSFLLQREDVEVIVVDNGSEDGTIHFLHDKYPDITAISLDKKSRRCLCAQSRIGTCERRIPLDFGQ